MPQRSVTKKRTAKRATSDSLIDCPVVYIHGIGTQPAAAALKLDWDLALFGRDMAQRTAMAYWTDLIRPPATAGVGAKKATKSRRSDADQPLDPEQILAEAGITNPKARRFARDLGSRLGAGIESTTGGFGKKVLPLPGFIRRPLSRIFLEAFLGDVATYLFVASKRATIKARLQAVLPPPGTQFVLVAHSLGTVVSYELLRQSLAGRKKDVRQFVTLGSPLGIQEVQDFLEPKSLEVPQYVDRWTNFADPFDPVATDKSLADDFRPKGTVDDHLLLNRRTSDLRHFNPHSAVGYLSHPDVRTVVHQAAKFDSMSRFVAARDVVERLGVDGRHSVLIEILEPRYPALADLDKEGSLAEQEARELARIRERQPGKEPVIDLEGRIERAAVSLRGITSNNPEARIDPLRRYLSARLTSDEIRAVAEKHQELRVYAIWRSAEKRKILWRSTKVLQADAARVSYGATGRDVLWAVLDTGVQANHPHFHPRGGPVVTAVWDCTREGPPVQVRNATDPDGHGSHVAGIIAGSDPAGRNDGVAPEARLVIYKVLGDDGRGEDAYIIKALDHIAAYNENRASIGIHGVNLSLGGPYDPTVYGCGYSAICQELRRLWRSGVLVVVASGNEGRLAVSTPDGDAEVNSVMSIGDPANLEDCIAVGSVHADKPHLYGISAFSSRGPTSDGRAKPDVVAPGERISSCNAKFRRGAPATFYRAESGTSMAAPHVSGLLAAFLSVRREFRGRPDEVKQILLDCCTDLGRDRYHQGRGMPNLMKMLLTV